MSKAGVTQDPLTNEAIGYIEASAALCGVNAWWLAAALETVYRGHFVIFYGRSDGTDPYLLRCWLTVPSMGPGGTLDNPQWDSQKSVVLHHFIRGDDDEALHDHPAAFTTHILSGGYDEHLPPEDWLNGADKSIGPCWNQRIVSRAKFSWVKHAATDLHCVRNVLPGTWTLVTFEEKVRTWGFHPEGESWIHWTDYLRRKRST